MGKFANRQSLAVQRTRSTLASHSAVPRGTNVKRMNANRAIRIAAHNERGPVRTNFCASGGGRYGRQRPLAIRIAMITLACDSAITIARFLPSKVMNEQLCVKTSEMPACSLVVTNRNLARENYFDNTKNNGLIAGYTINSPLPQEYQRGM